MQFFQVFLKTWRNSNIRPPLSFTSQNYFEQTSGSFFKTSLRFSKTVLVLLVPTSTSSPKMLKDKKKQKVSDRPLPPLYSAEDIPSQNCKDFLIELIVRYYEEINLCTLESM